MSHGRGSERSARAKPGTAGGRGRSLKMGPASAISREEDQADDVLANARLAKKERADKSKRLAEAQKEMADKQAEAEFLQLSLEPKLVAGGGKVLPLGSKRKQSGASAVSRFHREDGAGSWLFVDTL